MYCIVVVGLAVGFEPITCQVCVAKQQVGFEPIAEVFSSVRV